MTGVTMLSRILLAALLAAPMAPAAAPRSMSQTSKPGKAKAVEQADPAGEALGRALAGALEESLEAMRAFEEVAADLALRKAGRSGALRAMAEERASLAKALERGRGAQVPEGAEAAKDAFLVMTSQALKGMDLYMEGVKEGDGDKEEKGEKLVELARADLEDLRADEGAAGAYSGAAGQAIGASMGFNGSAGFAGTTSNGSLGLNYSFPISRSVDLGLGSNLGYHGNDPPGRGNFTGSVILGASLFVRKHFLGAFQDKPWMVPFLGGQVGMNLNMDLYTDDSATGTTAGLQAGMLVFTNRNTAMNFQLQYDLNAGETASDPSINLSFGLRYML